MAEYTDNAIKYEERIRSLLKRLKIEKVRGGPDYRIGGNQIDAIGVCDNVILIIECTTKKTNHRAKVEQLMGKMSSIRKGLQSDSNYKDIFSAHQKVKFIYASQTRSLESELKAKFSSRTLEIWDADEVEYYEELAKVLPSRAKFDLLSDIGFTRSDKRNFVVPAQKYQFNHQDIYLFMMDPIEMIKISYVPRRSSGKTGYYQRMIDPSRVTKINQYLSSGKEIFPSNVIVSFDKKSPPTFHPLNAPGKPNWIETGMLTIPNDYRSCFVIDGQHRLFSFSEGLKQKIPVLAFSNITFATQMKYFTDINQYAKPIQSGLLWDLIGEMSPNSEKGIISNAVKKLNLVEPFANKIALNGSTNRISMNSISGSIMRMQLARPKISLGKKRQFFENPFYSDEHVTFSDNICNGFRYYFAELKARVGDAEYVNDFVFDSGGVSVFTYVYKSLIIADGTKSLHKVRREYVPMLAKYLTRKSENEIIRYRRLCSSEGGKSEIVHELILHLSERFGELTEFIPEYNEPIREEANEFDEAFTTLLISASQKYTAEKLKKYFKAFDLVKIESRIGHRHYSVAEFIDGMSLGQRVMLFKIIFNSEKQKMLRLFIRTELDGIDHEDLRYGEESKFLSALDSAVSYRNKLSHPSKSPSKFIPDIEKPEATLIFRRLSKLLRQAHKELLDVK